MDPLQAPLWKFLYQGLNNNWLRRIAYGRDVFVVPFDNIGRTVFVAELVQQLKSRNVGIDRLGGYRTRQQGTNLQQKEATQQIAAAPDPSSQQRILDLETEIAKLKAAQGDDGSTPADGPPPNTPAPIAPVVQSLQGRSQALQPSIPHLGWSCLALQTRGRKPILFPASPMGSPLTALCLMVVALSEEVWFRTYQTVLASLDLSYRLLRYVGNRMCLVDPHWLSEPCIANFLHPDFYGKPILFWRRNLIRNSWASSLSSNLSRYATRHPEILTK